MNHNLKVSGSIEINASPSKVWDVLTNPELIKEYLFGTQTVTDWKVGSEIIFQGEYQGQKYRDKGVIKENILNKKLSYTYWSGFSGLEDKPENYSLATYTLSSSDNTKTVFTWTHQGFPTEANQQHTQSNIESCLKQIKEISER